MWLKFLGPHSMWALSLVIYLYFLNNPETQWAISGLHMKKLHFSQITWPVWDNTAS